MTRLRQHPMQKVTRKKVGEKRKTRIFDTRYVDKADGEYRQFRDENIWVNRFGSVIYYDHSVPKPYTQWYVETKRNGMKAGTDICILTGKHKRWSVKRLVWECFMGEIPKDCAVVHKMNVKTYNELYNLKLVPKSDLGKVYGGMNNKTRFVIERKSGKQFRGCNEAGKYFGLCKSSVARICNRKMKSKDGYDFVWGELVSGTL